jgi:hypothetical protein
MKHEMTKAQRRLMRELADRAYERELTRELGMLEADFARWHLGEIDVHALSEQIHRFHDGPARRLYVVYMNTHHEMAVGSAIGRGILTEEEATPEIIDALKVFIELAREGIHTDDDPGGAST